MAVTDLARMGPFESLYLVGALASLYELGFIVYCLFLHPLRKFPGPVLYRISRIPWAIGMVRGNIALKMVDMHEKYGPVVRIAPDEVSFADADAFKDIQGHLVGSRKNTGAEEMQKSPIHYDINNLEKLSIIRATREDHSRLRRAISHGFSERALKEQEPWIRPYVDLLIQRLHEQCAGGQKALDMVSWYNWTTFDIIGDLGFGEPFGCLERCEYDEWVSLIFKNIRQSAYLRALFGLGFEGFVRAWVRKGGPKDRQRLHQKAGEKLRRRIDLKAERIDLIEGLLKKRESLGVGFKPLLINADLIIQAGSETTATLLSGATYLLTSSPEILAKLNDEVRSTFKSEDEITMTTVNSCPFLLAVLNESLRLYPPVAAGMPRTVPKGGAEIAGHFVPENTIVSVYQLATYLSNRLWTRPQEFRPERFLGDSEFKMDRLDALQPFHVGPRNCIGKNLAYAEMRLILARVVFNFDMRLADDSKGWRERQRVFNIWEKGPLHVYLTPVRRVEKDLLAA